MPPGLSDTHLLLLSKGKAEVIKQYRFGVQVAQSSGLTIDRLVENACKDRLKFAADLLRCAKRLALSPSTGSRVVVARAYYAMYHTARATVYFIHKGDDFEAHSEVSKRLPDDFPSKASWENKLKTARLERNKADYDPYPKPDRAFRSSAQAILTDAEEFHKTVRRYLKRKGVPL